jgi:hypothetical protein
LNNNWKTIARDTNPELFTDFKNDYFNDRDWIQVNIPHNWDQYEGYRRLKHGNRHGYAWYRKTFTTKVKGKGKRYFIYFEGVGSYATVWVNGVLIGSHAGGRTTFTLDITKAIHLDKPNLLAVRADHPANIRDLPWVCGGCSDEWGFSEGSQPMGIFRPVHLVVTNDVRIEPHGVHIWNDSKVSEISATLNIAVEIKNYSERPRKIELVSRLINRDGVTIAITKTSKEIKTGVKLNILQNPMIVAKPILWSLENPYLYSLQTEIIEHKKVIDNTSTPYGIRWISWPIGQKNGSNQFLLNGKPVFINGTCEYEHNMGKSHAFSDAQIRTRAMQVKAAGYNAFRDAHQPHNLLYHANWDTIGLLWWPQFAAHIWFDNPEFKANFKQLLTDWVKERRNSPSIILWGLENESTLPTEFAKECTDLIRQLDPTASSQRKVTTCNGGTGTDWNVIQNWSGAYGGNPYNYANEMKSFLLNGEYGAWRSIDLHTEGPFVQNGTLSEDRFSLLMESKIRLAESVKDSICGQFHWLLNSHENPGRTQNGEGWRELDRVGPVNYKGLFTPWGEPIDAFYMFRSNYAPKDKEPMVYIVSHTWPGRWTTPGIKDSIIVYSNCDEVELFNDFGSVSLGKRTRNGIGTHFQWDSVNIQYNILYAKGYVNNTEIATDCIVLNHLPDSPGLPALKEEKIESITQGKTGYNYLYRINCGGPNYRDSNGNNWMADQHKTEDNTWGSKSWTDDFPGLPAFYGSQRRTFNPIKGTKDWKLFQSFRYGREKLSYRFNLPNGSYLAELYFIEPWYGIGGGMDCSGWRLFDVAINNKTVLKDLDIWKEAGSNTVLKKSYNVNVTDGKLTISFPDVASGQAIISAIAVASKDIVAIPSTEVNSVIENLTITDTAISNKWSIETWMDIGDKQYSNNNTMFVSLPSNLYGAVWIRTSEKTNKSPDDTVALFKVRVESDIFVAIDSRVNKLPSWLYNYNDTKSFIKTDNLIGNTFKVLSKRVPSATKIILGKNGSAADRPANMYTVIVCPVNQMEDAFDLRPIKKYEAEDAQFIGIGLEIDSLGSKKYVKFANTSDATIEWTINVGIAGTYSLKFRYINQNESTVPINISIIDANGIALKNDLLEFQPSVNWRAFTTTTGTMINAGTYKIRLSGMDKGGLGIDVLEVQ